MPVNPIVLQVRLNHARVDDPKEGEALLQLDGRARRVVVGEWLLEPELEILQPLLHATAPEATRSIYHGVEHAAPHVSHDSLLLLWRVGRDDHRVADINSTRVRDRQLRRASGGRRTDHRVALGIGECQCQLLGFRLVQATIHERLLRPLDRRVKGTGGRVVGDKPSRCWYRGFGGIVPRHCAPFRKVEPHIVREDVIQRILEIWKVEYAVLCRFRGEITRRCCSLFGRTLLGGQSGGFSRRLHRCCGVAACDGDL
mmetsp:Transcript_10484/g.34803  ORF Transcript_10484/g.34803 Transcript_10484/m.34803 type:complete len:256 (+) Transcript_10484:266-1033(+)